MNTLITFSFVLSENENFSIVEYHAIQKELEERNFQRDELLFKIKVQINLWNRIYSFSNFLSRPCSFNYALEILKRI